MSGTFKHFAKNDYNQEVAMYAHVISEKFAIKTNAVLAIFRELDKAMMDMPAGTMTDTSIVQDGIAALAKEVLVTVDILASLNAQDMVFNAHMWSEDIVSRAREVRMQAENMRLIIDNQMMMHRMYRVI